MGGLDETLRKILVTCMIFAALTSTALTVDHMVERAWQRRISGEREQRERARLQTPA
jgi:hypothetical protein